MEATPLPAVTGDVVEEPASEGQEHGSALRIGALSVVGSVAIALASAAPTASIALTLSAIVAAAGYASPVAVLVCGVPMLGIAVAYRRLNMWHVNCGGAYIWAGRAISPYFGFMVGWVIILAYLVGAMSIVLPIGPNALQLFDNSYQHSQTAAALIGTVALVFVTGVAYVGIRATARLQVLLIAIEYIALTILAVIALVAVFGGDSRSASFDWSWFSWGTLGGTSGFVSASLIAVYMYSGWDTAILLNEETENARVSPGNAVVISVIGLAVIFAVFTFALQGAVKSGALQANGDNALVYIAGTLGNSALAKVMVLTVVLSAVGSGLTCIVSGARVLFAMGYDRVIPSAFGRTHSSFRTPTLATIVGAVVALVALWGYAKGSGSVVSAFDTVISTVGLLFALFYAATGFAVAVYYRRLARRSVRGTLEIIVFPLASALFLCFIMWKSVGDLGGWTSSTMQYLYYMLAAGIALMAYARWRGESDYFQLPIETYTPPDELERQA